jgi:hypothetical protein
MAALVEFAGWPVSMQLESDPVLEVHPEVWPGTVVQPDASLIGIPLVPPAMLT